MVRTVKLSFTTVPQAIEIIAQWRKAQSVVIRTSYNRVRDGKKDKEILDLLRTMPIPMTPFAGRAGDYLDAPDSLKDREDADAIKNSIEGRRLHQARHEAAGNRFGFTTINHGSTKVPDHHEIVRQGECGSVCRDPLWTAPPPPGRNRASDGLHTNQGIHQPCLQNSSRNPRPRGSDPHLSPTLKAVGRLRGVHDRQQARARPSAA